MRVRVGCLAEGTRFPAASNIDRSRYKGRPLGRQAAQTNWLGSLHEGVQLDRVALAKVEGGLRSAFDFELKGLASVLNVDANWLLGIDAGAPPRGKRPNRRGKERA